MITFWLVALLFLAGAMLMLVPALLQPVEPGADASQSSLAVHRDQWRELEQDAAADLLAADRLLQARAEIQRRADEDRRNLAPAWQPAPARRTALALVLLVPLASVLTYLQIGRPQAVEPASVSSLSGAAHTMTEAQIIDRVSALAERLRADPGDADGWVMLGRSYTALGRYQDGAGALQRAVALAPGNAGLLADLADVTAMAQSRRLAGEPARLVQQALDADPHHAKSLALAGSVAFEAGDYAAARGYWQRLVAVLPPGSDMARAVQGSIDDAAQREGAEAAAATAVNTAPGAAGEVSGVVRISAALVDRIRPEDTLFVFARAAQGPRIPLAVLRRPVGQFPSAFTLDDSMAMSPALRLSGAAQVVIGARISRSGNATPQSGDLVGQSAVVRPGTRDLELVIDGTHP